MSFKTGTGSTFAIGTTLAAANGTQAEYEADSYTTVSEIESVGEFGDAREIVTFASLGDGRRQKARGIADAGDVPVVYADKTGDAGQLAIEAAFAVTSQAADEFNFRVQLNDSLGSNPTTYYFRARITELRVQGLSNDNAVLIRAMVAINTAVLKVAAA